MSLSRLLRQLPPFLLAYLPPREALVLFNCPHKGSLSDLVLLVQFHNRLVRNLVSQRLRLR